MVTDEFPQGLGVGKLSLQPGALFGRVKVRIENDELGVAILEGVRPFRRDVPRPVARQSELRQIKARLPPALILVVPQHWHQLPPIKHAFGILEETVPVPALRAAIDQIPRPPAAPRKPHTPSEFSKKLSQSQRSAPRWTKSPASK